MDHNRREQVHTRLNEMCKSLAVGGRSADVALLLWFLQHVERLEPIDAEDAVLERSRELQFDGVWVDEFAEQITLLQAKHFQGTRTLLPTDVEHISALARRMGEDSYLTSFDARQLQPELQGLLERQNLRQLLDAGYSLRLLVVTDGLVDANDKLAIQQTAQPHIDAEIWDLHDLSLYVEYANRPLYIDQTVPLDFAKNGVFSVSLPDSAPVTFGALGADQIANLPGIADRTLFAQNVRLDLGRTRVNKDLAGTVTTPSEHSRFLTFHNGLTILCKSVERDATHAERFHITGFSVVNGCQSALAFYNHRASLTPQLLVPVRLVQVGETTRLADDITYRSNNQNSISLKDLRANDSTQIQLQSEFANLFGSRLGYQIKRGEAVQGETVIANDLAAQILLALYVQQPWQAHRKSALFAEWYKDIFRPNIRAPHIALGYLIWQEVIAARHKIEDLLLARYGLTVFILVFLVGRLMEETIEGRQILAQPLPYLQEHDEALRAAIRLLVADVIVDFDGYIREEGASGYFDYKSRFKSQTAVRHLTEDIVRTHKKAVNRDPRAAFRLT